MDRLTDGRDAVRSGALLEGGQCSIRRDTRGMKMAKHVLGGARIPGKSVRFFYRAMLCIRGTSHGPVSVRPFVRLSVTSRSSTKTAEQRITQTTPHDSPGTLVF